MSDGEVVAADGGFVVRRDGRDQSHVDLDDPTRLAFDYVRRLGDVLDAREPAGAPLRVVHVGGAGLTLPRYVAATRPRSAQVVLEPDAALTALVREALPLPARSGIKVRAVDGRTGLAALREDHAEVVVLDAFDAGRVPGALVTRECFAELARVLVEDGWALLNLSDRAPWQHTRRVLAGLAEHLPHLLLTAEPATLKGRRPGNLVVVATRGRVPEAALRARRGAVALPYRVLGSREVRDAFGGGRCFTDADAEDGPAP